MTLNEYQDLAMRTSNKELTGQGHLLNGMLGLAGEVGECSDLVKKHYFQDHRDIQDKLFDELSDVLWYVAETATAMGWSLDDIAWHNVNKLRERYPEGFDEMRSLYRKEYQ